MPDASNQGRRRLHSEACNATMISSAGCILISLSTVGIAAYCLPPCFCTPTLTSLMSFFQVFFCTMSMCM